MSKSALLLLLPLLVGLSGCQNIKFYQQAVTGQAQLLWQRTDTAELLTAADTDPALRARLEWINDLLAFSAAQGLSAGGSFQSYVETGQPFVIWNVFASKPLELSLKPFCFPVAGCVSYRGYFKQLDAQRYARVLRDQGYEVYVGGVAAYSTLGWFNDPLLDTFLFRAQDEVAALVFHELAHQIVYVAGDTRFNESVATSVEQYLLKRWLLQTADQAAFDRYLASRLRQEQVLQLIDVTRQQLREVYASNQTTGAKTQQKQAAFNQLRQRYEQLQASWPEGHEYARWMQSPMSNAKLETVADYNEWVPGLLGLLERDGMQAFDEAVIQLSRLPASERQAQLLRLTAISNTAR